jgi:transposase-like protein
MEKFTADEKVAIVMESFTSNNIAELCRRHGVSVASFYKCRDKFIESGKKGFYSSGGNNGYEREIEKLKRLVGDQALVIDELKKITEGGDNGNSKQP